MTATDELRRMLDERGVEHYDGTECTLWLRDGVGYRASADELANGRMSLYMLCETPEQAIAATLGSCNCSDNCTGGERTETCYDEGDPGDFCCSACGVRMFTEANDTYTMIASDERTIIKRPNYCPNCGRRCVG